jgi:hypothetical protein
MICLCETLNQFTVGMKQFSVITYQFWEVLNTPFFSGMRFIKDKFLQIISNLLIGLRNNKTHNPIND